MKLKDAPRMKEDQEGLFLAYKDQIVRLMETAVPPNDSAQDQIDRIVLFGLLSEDGVAKDAALHILSVYARGLACHLGIHVEAFTNLTLKIKEHCVFSLASNEVRATHFVTAYNEALDHILLEVKKIAQTQEPVRLQQEITGEFYKS